MGPFTHYHINETENGIEIILYLDQSLTEFSNELGDTPHPDASSLKEEALDFVKNMFPTIKVKSVKIMAGAMVLSTLGFGALPLNQASAAEATVTQAQTSASTHKVSPGDTLYSLATRHGTTVDAIKQANGLTSNNLQIGQTLTIPSGEKSANAQSTTSYQVVSGDTLYSIAARHGTTVNAIKQANGLTSNNLQIGQTLTIPFGEKSANAQSASSYQVVAGDTLYSIATRHGTTVNAIKQANGLSSNTLKIGQNLTIPSDGGVMSAPVPTTTGSTYQVVSGDTLYSIATRHGTTVNAIKQANGLSTNTLKIGQNLTIPSAVPSPAPIDAEKQEALDWLAKMIYSEGRGESLKGQIAIGAVIMNRVNSPLFPNNVKDVLFEKSYGYYQFTPAETGVIHDAKPNEQNYEAAKRAMNGEDPTDGALFFYNPDKTSSDYLRSRTVSTVIGNHTFAF